MSIAIEQSDERFYLVGHTFSLKETIKSLGCKFDAAKKQWYASKQEIAEQIVLLTQTEAPAAVTSAKATISATDKIIRGRAKYRSHEYYVQTPRSLGF